MLNAQSHIIIKTPNWTSGSCPSPPALASGWTSAASKVHVVASFQFAPVASASRQRNGLLALWGWFRGGMKAEGKDGAN